MKFSFSQKSLHGYIGADDLSSAAYSSCCIVLKYIYMCKNILIIIENAIWIPLLWTLLAKIVRR